MKLHKARFPSQKLPVKTKKNCTECGIEITKDIAIYYYGSSGIQPLCKPCRKKRNTEKTRKKQAIIKKHPLW